MVEDQRKLLEGKSGESLSQLTNNNSLLPELEGACWRARWQAGDNPPFVYTELREINEGQKLFG